MPDISMCDGINCEIKQHCYRFTATADKYLQTYFSPLVKKIDGVMCCEDFWGVKPTQHSEFIKKPNKTK